MKVEQTNDCQQTNPQGVCSVSRVPYVSIWMYMVVQMMLYICRVDLEEGFYELTVMTS